MRDPQTARFYDISNDLLVADVELYVDLARQEGGPVCERIRRQSLSLSFSESDNGND